jgi:hypothetical protein
MGLSLQMDPGRLTKPAVALIDAIFGVWTATGTYVKLKIFPASVYLYNSGCTIGSNSHKSQARG